MTRLSFRLDFHTGELQSLELPIEVRDASMKLVKETTARDEFDIDPGDYLITAKLPAGQKLTKIVQVEGNAMVCDLAPDTDASPNEWREPVHYFQSARARVAAAGSMTHKLFKGVVQQSSPSARLRIFTGNPIQGGSTETNDELNVDVRAADVVRLSLGASDAPRFVQFLQPEKSPVNIAVPTSVLTGCTVVIYRERTRYWIELLPQNEQASLILGYRQNDAAQQQAAVAEGMLQQKMEDPITAAIGGYALLRFSEIERLHDWTKNLCDFFPTLPDGAAIYGEHLARLGRHAEALKAFQSIPARGLPIFSDGIRFMLDRLKVYAEGEPATPAKQLREMLNPYFRAVDFDKALTTFAGSDPAHPDATRRAVSGQLPSTGVDVRSWFA